MSVQEKRSPRAYGPLVKPIARKAVLRGRTYTVDLGPDGVGFRELRRRFRIVAPLVLVLGLAEKIAGEELRRMLKLRRQERRAGR